MGSDLSDAPSRALPVEPGAQPLASLIARVEAAPGPDSGLDLDVHMAVEPSAFPQGWYWDDQRPLPATGSLDAALTLVERVAKPLGLYGWRLELDDEPVHHPYYASLAFSTRSPLYDGPEMRGGISEADGASPALALLAALLKALQTQPLRHDARDGASPQNNGPSQ